MKCANVFCLFFILCTGLLRPMMMAIMAHHNKAYVMASVMQVIGTVVASSGMS
jgi:hypothetical protein